MADTVLNVADVVAAYGAYYLGNPGNQARLFAETYRMIGEIEMDVLQLQPTSGTRWESSDSILQDVLQPFQKDWTPNSQLDFIPHPIDLFKAKAELNVCPDELSYSWLMFLEGDGIDRREWPFIRWLIEVHFLPKLADNIDQKAIYKGIQAAPIAGTPGTPGQAMNGLEKVMDDYVTNGLAAPIALGPIPSLPEDFVSYVEDFIDAIDDRYRFTLPGIQMSEQLAVRYSRGYEAKYGTGVRVPGSTQNSQISGYSTVVKGMTSMQGKTRLWATVPNNGLLVAKKWNNTRQVETRLNGSNPREVDIWTDFYAAPDFAVPRLVFFTDQV